MSTQTFDGRNDEKTPLVWGLLALAIGVFIVLQALGVVPTSSMNAPVWVGVLGGLVFVLGGLAIALQSVGGASAATGELPASAPGWMRVAQYIGVLLIFAAFAMIGSWIAFWPGERAFGMSLGGFEGASPALVGRAAFGFGAVITWLCFFGVLASGLRQLRARRGQ
jgi:hypothetical protein